MCKVHCHRRDNTIGDREQLGPRIEWGVYTRCVGDDDDDDNNNDDNDNNKINPVASRQPAAVISQHYIYIAGACISCITR